MRKLEELLEDYRSGLLSPEEERFVEEQLTEKPELLEEAQAIAFVWEAVKQQVKQDEKEKLKAQLLEDTELREEYEGELQKHLTTEDSADPEKEKKIVPVVPAKTRKKWHPAYPIAASIIGLLVMVFAFFNPFAQKETTEELASTQAILVDSTYKHFIHNQLSVRGGSRGGGDSISNLEFKETDSTLLKLFEKDSLETVISYLDQKSSVSKLWPKDSLFLAVAYYHTKAYQKSAELLENLLNPDISPDIKKWYLARNYIQQKDLEKGKQVLCDMKANHSFQLDKVKALLKNFEFTCP